MPSLRRVPHIGTDASQGSDARTGSVRPTSRKGAHPLRISNHLCTSSLDCRWSDREPRSWKRTLGDDGSAAMPVKV